MNRAIPLCVAAFVAMWSGGCASGPAKSGDGQAVFGALQRAVANAGKKAEPSLAVVKVENAGASAPTRRTIGGITFTDNSSSDSGPSSGIVVTPKGHVLVPGVIKPDADGRITVFIGETEHVARSVKTDDALGMTILKLDGDDAFTPLDLGAGADLAVGEWAVVIRPTDEAYEFQKHSLLGVCQGERPGRYRKFMLNQSLTGMSGALVVNLSGQIVGMVERTSVLSLSDIREDLQRFIAEATGANVAEDDKKKRGWFGALLEPVNKDYARARKLPASALVVLHAAKDGSAAAAGVRDGDLITGVNGRPLRLSGVRAMDYFTKSLRPRAGEKFTVSVLRDGKQLELAGTFAKAPEAETLRAEDLGVTVTGITDNDVHAQNLNSDRGVLVTDVHRGSPAANSGTLRQTLISRRDIILELAGQPTPDVVAFGKVLEKIRREKPPVVLVKYCRGILNGYAGLNLTLGEKDNGNKQ
jgi:S1-C subfamily serine protease